MDRGGGLGTVLVVDDVAAVATATARILERAGYRVHVAQDAETAVEIAVSHPIDVVLSDVVLGASGDGLDLAEQLVARRPGVRVIFMSGYASFSGDRFEDDPVLTKPFTADELLGRVAEALGRA